MWSKILSNFFSCFKLFLLQKWFPYTTNYEFFKSICNCFFRILTTFLVSKLIRQYLSKSWLLFIINIFTRITNCYLIRVIAYYQYFCKNQFPFIFILNLNREFKFKIVDIIKIYPKIGKIFISYKYTYCPTNRLQLEICLISKQLFSCHSHYLPKFKFRKQNPLYNNVVFIIIKNIKISLYQNLLS